MAVRRTHNLAAKTVAIDLVTDDVRNQMTGILVVNTSNAAVQIGIVGGRTFTVGARVSISLPLLASDERDIDAKVDGRRLGRPFTVAYPWFE